MFTLCSIGVNHGQQEVLQTSSFSGMYGRRRGIFRSHNSKSLQNGTKLLLSSPSSYSVRQAHDGCGQADVHGATAPQGVRREAFGERGCIGATGGIQGQQM